MTNRDLFHAIGGLDGQFIMDAAPGKTLKNVKSFRIKRAAAACFFLLLSAILIFALRDLFAPTPIAPSDPGDGGIGGTEKPDRIYSFDIGERMICTCGKCYAVFNNVFFTKAVGEHQASDGGYLIFVASVNTDHHWLAPDRVTLDGDTLESGRITFHEVLSEQFSDTENAFDRQTTALHGKISFIFHLNEDACRALAGAMDTEKLTLSPDISWHGGLCLFDFPISAINKIDKYK